MQLAFVPLYQYLCWTATVFDSKEDDFNKRDKNVFGGTLSYAELKNINSSTDIFRMFKPRKIRWTERVAPTEKIKNVQHFDRTFFDQNFPAGARKFCLLQNVENSTGTQPGTCA